jgi:uncharacterized protein with HEPN domain
MPDRQWKLFVSDIQSAIEKVLSYTAGMDKNQFMKDHKTYDAVLRNLEIIGEAVKNIPDEIKADYDSIEWKKIAGLRDIIVHGYFGIDDDIIWDVICNKLDALLKTAQSILS